MRFIALLLCMLLTLAPLGVMADSRPFAGREEFYFGVTGHNYGYEAYPQENLEEQIQLAAQLGSGLYRINAIPTDRPTRQYVEQVISLCDTYGLAVMLVLDAFPGNTEEAIYQNAKTIASRFGSSLALIQAGNELDNQCITSPTVDGSQTQHFDTEAYDRTLPKLKALLQGLTEGAPTTKTVVNIAYRHHGFLSKLVADGVDFDVVGWDWYSNMGDYKEVFPTLLSFQKPVMICETNIWDGIGKDNTDERTRYLTEFMNYVYYHQSPLPLGFLVYELLDEPAFGENSNVEAHFGLIDCERNGTVIAPKQAYYDIQELWLRSMMYGDVNRNGGIDAGDALWVLKYSVDKIDLTYQQTLMGDVDKDQLIGPQDALLILQKAVGVIDQFPVEIKKYRTNVPYFFVYGGN